METNSTEILLVEDDEVILKSTASSLKSIGFKVKTAKDGEEALKIFEDRLKKEKPIKVVVTDMVMPNMNGMKLIKEIYKKRSQTAFIVCSAYAELKEELENFPCIRRIHTKPLEISNIIQDLITIFTNREWELIPNDNLEQHKIHKNAYIAIQKIISHLV